jgi:hypothetical protein
MASFWIFLASGIFMYSSVPFGLAPNDGWFNYVPLSGKAFTPDKNIDFYTLGLIFLTIATTAGAANFIVTIFKLRAPGMSINRMPLFCWAVLTTSFAVIFALPALTVANTMLELERTWGFHFFQPAHGGDPLLWQHLFWIFGHPDVYIIFLPAVGIVSSIVPVFSRRSIVAYEWLALATVLTGLVGFGNEDTIAGSSILVLDLHTAQRIFDKQGKLKRLKLIQATECKYELDGDNDPDAMRKLHERYEEATHEYQDRIVEWNRVQKARRRAGRTSQTAREFLAFLGLA